MADYRHPESLVTTDWVAQHGSDSNVRLVEVDVEHPLTNRATSPAP